MVVYEWFARISQVLAPDKQYNDEVFDEPAKQDSVSLWHILAPDPNFTKSAAASESNDQIAVTTPKAGSMQTPEAQNSAVASAAAPTYTPSPYRNPWNGDNKGIERSNNNVLSSLQSPRPMAPFSNHAVEQQVLSAAKDRAMIMISQVASIRTAAMPFRICKNRTALQPNLRAKLNQMILADPSLLQMRSSGPSFECPDGYTMFMAATDANQVGAMEVIWECCNVIDEQNENNDTSRNLFTSRTLEGKNVLHIAAERGHIEALEFIKEKLILVFGETTDANTTEDNDTSNPVTLLGYTPLGLALMSPEVKAKKNKIYVLATLYNDNDTSILGSPFPVEQRIVGASSSASASSSVRKLQAAPSRGPKYNTLRAIAGMSEIPGKRIRMEDCTICHASDSAIILAVCDGHGDEGRVSQYVAEGLVTGLEEHLPTLLLSEGGASSESTTTTPIDPESTSWEFVCTDLCLRIDDALVTTGLRGGSVGVSMVVTTNNIVVASIGDCRCILVQLSNSSSSPSVVSTADDLVEQTKDMTITDDNSSTHAGENWSNMYHVKELSTDHKPNLPLEQERIKNSGLKVIAEKVDASLTIHKIQLSEGNKLATSRAFGDFEYKVNDKLEIHEQAVIAIPDVMIHERCDDDIVMIAACDGIWDVMTNEEVAMFVTQRLDQYSCTAEQQEQLILDATILPKIGDELILECLHRNSEDNMSVVIVALSQLADRFVLEAESAIAVPPKQLKYESTTV